MKLKFPFSKKNLNVAWKKPHNIFHLINGKKKNSDGNKSLSGLSLKLSKQELDSQTWFVVEVDKER